MDNIYMLGKMFGSDFGASSIIFVCAIAVHIFARFEGG